MFLNCKSTVKFQKNKITPQNTFPLHKVFCGAKQEHITRYFVNYYSTCQRRPL